MPTLDLRAFGPIGFQDFYLEKQGYKGKNLLKLIVDRCFDVNLDFCAITSCAEHVIPGSVHDRFGYLLNDMISLPKNYKWDLKCFRYKNVTRPSLLVIEKDEKRTCLINSQAVLCRVGNKRVDHMIIGSNQIPSYTLKPWEENIAKLKELGWVVDYAKENGLVQIALHPFAHNIHSSVGGLIKPYLNEISAIEGQCSEFCIGKNNPNEKLVEGFSKEQDELAQKFSEENDKPWIAVSAAHRIEDIGLSHIKTEEKLRYDDAYSFLKDLKSILENRKFENKVGYQSEKDLMKWVKIYLEAINVRQTTKNLEDL